MDAVLDVAETLVAFLHENSYVIKQITGAEKIITIIFRG